MNEKEIENKILKVLTLVLKIEADGKTSRQSHFEWDSLKHIEIIFAIEDELQIQFPEDQLSGLDSVQKLVQGVIALHAP